MHTKLLWDEVFVNFVSKLIRSYCILENQKLMDESEMSHPTPTSCFPWHFRVTLEGFPRIPLASMAKHSTDSSGLLVQSWAAKVWTSHSSLLSLQESRSFLDCQMSFISRYVDWANLTVRLSQPPCLCRRACTRVSPLIRAFSLRSPATWVSVGRWLEPWTRLRLFSARRW